LAFFSSQYCWILCAGEPIDRSSISDYYTFVGDNLDTWRSKEQAVNARSSVEAEYQAMAHTACEII